MTRQIFINLAVENVKKSRTFFTELWFSFNENFSNEEAACLVIAENISVMLLSRNTFKWFLPHKDIADTFLVSEWLYAISVENKQDVDDMTQKALSLWANEFREPQDHWFMYGRAFEDLDWHVWELYWMDQTKD